MIYNLRLNKIFWSIPTLLALLAASAGVINRDIYNNLFPKDFLPGAFPQDILTIIVSFFMFFLIKTTKKGDIKPQIIIVGLLGSLFYLYGIFTIERVYNWYYLLYAAIFASSFWAIIYTLSGFRSNAFNTLRINSIMVKVTAISSIIIAVMFTFLWTMALIPLMRHHDRIDFLYSIYILDLCFIMPAFVITAVMSLRKLPFGILMGPAIMIMGFFVIFPLGLNELAKPSEGMVTNIGAMAVSFSFALFMLFVAGLHLKMIRVK